jgi:hypothetical protein
MALYTLCPHPFLLDLERRLPGVCIDLNSKPVSVVAYADDVTIFLTTASDILTVEEAIRQFEKNSAQITRLSHWKMICPDNPMGIVYNPNTPILGFQFWSTLRHSVNPTWSFLTGQVRLYAKESYQRDLCITHRMAYVRAFLLALVWYVAQGPPSPKKCTQQITSAMNSLYGKVIYLECPSLHCNLAK